MRLRVDIDLDMDEIKAAAKAKAKAEDLDDYNVSTYVRDILDDITTDFQSHVDCFIGDYVTSIDVTPIYAHYDDEDEDEDGEELSA